MRGIESNEKGMTCNFNTTPRITPAKILQERFPYS